MKVYLYLYTNKSICTFLSQKIILLVVLRRKTKMRLRLALVIIFQTLVNAQQRECNEVDNVFKSITDCVTSIASPKSSFRVSSQRQHASGSGQSVNYEDRGY